MGVLEGSKKFVTIIHTRKWFMTQKRLETYGLDDFC